MPPARKKKKHIPPLAIPRLSLYYRALLESRETHLISSEEMASITGFGAAQVRRDLTYFGQFGIPGRGYQVKELKKALVGILGLDREWNVGLVGVGNLGRALLSYQGFQKQGMKIVAAFDSDASKFGKKIGEAMVYDSSDLVSVLSRENIKMLILATPASQAQTVINQAASSGVKAILNFAPIRPKIPSGMKILNIDMAIELERLSYMATRE